MPNWIKRWLDWARFDWWSLRRLRPQAHSLRHGYEKAGLTIFDQAVPWAAEGVLVEAHLRLPNAVARRKSDFQLRVPGLGMVAPEILMRQPSGDHYRLLFRFQPPGRTVTTELLWRQQRFATATLPYLARGEFLEKLRVEMPTTMVRFEKESIACQSFVNRQGRGLILSAVLHSPTNLAPVAELGMSIELRSERGGAIRTVPVQLSISQLAQTRALVAVAPRRRPRRLGNWFITWMLGGQPILTQCLRVISPKQFCRSLRLVDSRFMIESSKGRMRLARQLPAFHDIVRAGPCFLVASQEPGMAGWAPLEVRVHVTGEGPRVLFSEEVLISDGPTVLAPGTLTSDEITRVTGFELRTHGESLGLVSTSPIPTANFTSEGGFRAPADFPWTAAAEEELNERLSRLVEERGDGR
jgi:hypothetical protein